MDDQTVDNLEVEDSARLRPMSWIEGNELEAEGNELEAEGNELEVEGNELEVELEVKPRRLSQ